MSDFEAGEPPMQTPDVVATRTYTNPVYAGYFADPFMWKVQDEYYAVGTGPMEASGQVSGPRRCPPRCRCRCACFPCCAPMIL